MTLLSLPFLSRIWLSWVCAFRILYDGVFAASVLQLRDGEPQRESLPTAAPAPAPAAVAPAFVAVEQAPAASGALQLLALLQREGRFLDFVEQDVALFPDADIGAAARVVHEGCRRALHAHARVVSVRSEAEGARITLEQPSEDVKLVGNVAGAAPFRGVLRHRGWRVEDLALPTLIGAHDARIVAAAELEL